MMTKPTMDEVLAFVTPKIEAAVKSKGRSKPLEQQEEAKQDALLAVIEAYGRLEPEKYDQWKGFVDMRGRGAVTDYFKQGKGFIEDRKGKSSRLNLTERASNTDRDGKHLDISQVANIFELLRESDDFLNIEIKWDVVSRMSRADSSIHLLAKLILGFSMDELEAFFKTPKEILSNRYRRFLKRLDLPCYARDPWMDHFIFAFGLSETFSVKEVDNGLSSDFEPVDLYSDIPLKKISENDGPALSWISQIFPDDFNNYCVGINWDLLAKMSAIDEELCLISLILKGYKRSDLANFFEDSEENLKSRALRFCKKLDQKVITDWNKQCIYALGLSGEFYGEQDSGLGHFVVPIDLDSFSNYSKAIKGKSQLSLLAVI